MPNIFKLCQTHFFRGRETNLRPPGYGPACKRPQYNHYLFCTEM